MRLTELTKQSIIILLKDKFKSGNYLQENYETSKRPIGEGTSGKVYKAKNIQTSSDVALKSIDLDYECDYSDTDSTPSTSQSDQSKLAHFLQSCQEAVLQSETFKHLNIVPVYDKWIQPTPNTATDGRGEDLITIIEYLESVEDGADPTLETNVREALVRTKGLSLYLTMELYDKDLNEWLYEKQTENEEELKEISRKIFSDIVNGLKYIHGEQYIHVDLKPRNILLKYDSDQEIYTAALSDFGLSRSVTTQLEDIEFRSGTYPYNSAPEKFFSCKFDLWSLGLIIYQMTIKEYVGSFELDKLAAAAKKDPQSLQQLLNNSSPSITANERLQQTFHMITQCLQQDPNNRCNASDFDEQDLW